MTDKVQKSYSQLFVRRGSGNVPEHQQVKCSVTSQGKDLPPTVRST